MTTVSDVLQVNSAMVTKINVIVVDGEFIVNSVVPLGHGFCKVTGMTDITTDASGAAETNLDFEFYGSETSFTASNYQKERRFQLEFDRPNLSFCLIGLYVQSSRFGFPVHSLVEQSF